jgi:hypothetical protein
MTDYESKSNEDLKELAALRCGWQKIDPDRTWKWMRQDGVLAHHCPDYTDPLYIGLCFRDYVPMLQKRCTIDISYYYDSGLDQWIWTVDITDGKYSAYDTNLARAFTIVFLEATEADALKEHIEQCPKHPMSKLKEDYLEERANVQRLHLRLRHASYQAERDTKELTKVKTDYVLVKAEVEAAGSELLVLQQECIKLKRENVQLHTTLEEAKRENVQLQIALEDQILAYSLDVG